jgi:hypothetical protein
MLEQLLQIYKNKHPSDWEVWFNRMAEDLIETGDVTRHEYIAFCAENDIFLKPKKKKTPPSYPSNDGGCGSSGRSSSGC